MTYGFGVLLPPHCGLDPDAALRFFSQWSPTLMNAGRSMFFIASASWAYWYASTDPMCGKSDSGLGERPVIVSIGHVHNLRDRCDLIAAMPEVLRAIPQAHLLIVGDVLTEKPRNLVASLGLVEHVTFTGGVAHSQIGDYLSAATIEAHWLNETPGLGIAAMEAMSAGKAVVSSIGPDDLGPGLLKPGENIFLIEPGSTQSIAGAVIRLLGDADLRARVGEAGRRLILEEFSWASVTDQQEDLYRRVLERAGRGARG